MFYIRLTFVDERAIVSRARYAVGVREHAPTDALASINVDGNRLKQLVTWLSTLDRQLTYILLLFLPI